MVWVKDRWRGWARVAREDVPANAGIKPSAAPWEKDCVGGGRRGGGGPWRLKRRMGFMKFRVW